ncbi:response regulator [Cohnella terricola]|uniref:Response regulator n=1 Tax=Cohnella terricola TaxID=1289167 RepID=A0A559IV58_9BACL|nr:response regulator [Cohnella terricola]TVX91525.1 response regulator [Cohnella terricola]
MIKAILIDDEEIALDVLEILLLEIGGVTVIGKYRMVSEALERIEELQPDLIFLDIEMPGTNGLVGGEMLATRYPRAEIVFVTAYHQYAIEAFDTNAIGYLLKPVVKEKLVKSLSRYDKIQEKLAKSAGRSGNSTENGAIERAAEQKRLRLKVMGNLQLNAADGRLVTWRTKKTKELFAYLWSRAGEHVYRYNIIDDLWPDVNFERAQPLFHTTMYNLRNTLRTEGFPDMVAFGDERYRMNAESIESDLGRLHELMQNGSGTAAIEELTSLYRGDYLEMEHYGWALSQRNKHRAAYVRHLDELSKEASLKDKEALYRKIFELDPCHERNYNRLLDLLIELGDHSAAEKLSEEKKRLDLELS